MCFEREGDSPRLSLKERILNFNVKVLINLFLIIVCILVAGLLLVHPSFGPFSFPLYLIQNLFWASSYLYHHHRHLHLLHPLPLNLNHQINHHLILSNTIGLLGSTHHPSPQLSSQLRLFYLTRHALHRCLLPYHHQSHPICSRIH